MSNKFLCYANRIFYMIFQKIFKFGKWHANAPFYCRPYKKKVVDIINDLKPVTIIEIGCGLGEIISRVNARNKYGIDIDANAIKFGALLARNVTFINGSFDAIYKIPEKHIDVLVLINWTHGLEPAFIKKEIYNLLKIKRLFI